MKKIIKTFVVLAMIFSFTTVDVSAATLDGFLKLYASAKSGDGYTWDGETLTLCDDLVITSASGNAIHFDSSITSDVTIDLNGYNLTIDADEAGIYADYGVTIKNSVAESGGEITIASGYTGIYSGKGNITITCSTLTITSDEKPGIYATDNASITCDYLKITSNAQAVQAEKGVIINCKDLLIDSSWTGILSNEGEVVMTITGNATITSKTGIAIDGDSEDSDITLLGTGSLSTDGYIRSRATVSIGDISVTGLKCEWTKNDGDLYSDEIVYGDFVFTDNTVIYAKNYIAKLSFAEGSTFTVASGVTADLSEYESIDFTNANIIVEDGGSIDYGTNADGVSYAKISSLTIDDWEYTDEANTPLATAYITNDDGDFEFKGEISYTYSTSLDGTYTLDVPEEVGTYYVKASITTTVDDNNYVTIGTYAIEDFEILTKYYTVVIDDVEEKVEHGTVIEVPTKDGYTFDGWVDEDEEVYTSEITVTSDLNLSTTWTKDVVDSTDDDGDTSADADTDTDTDDVVDTGDANNVLLFTSLSVGAMALILMEMKKRSRV